MLIQLDEAKDLHARLNEKAAIPIHYILEVGYQCGEEMAGKDRETVIYGCGN
jgi:hypothetical protein